MANHQIKAQRRKDEGKGASRRLRHAGMIPAIIYGGEQRPVSIQLNHEQIWLAQQNEWFYSSILDLNVDGGGARRCYCVIYSAILIVSWLCMLTFSALVRMPS